MRCSPGRDLLGLCNRYCAGLTLPALLQELHDIVKQCLQKDPALRPTTSQLLKHKFFKASTTTSPGAKVACIVLQKSGVPLLGAAIAVKYAVARWHQQIGTWLRRMLRMLPTS